MSKAYVYTVARDYGFAPNPFHGVLTLATCKPGIRKSAKVGDFVIGHSSKSMGNKIIYMMKVSDALSFDEYWNDVRFQSKKAVMNGSIVKLYGDNIYHHNKNGVMEQADSHHSYPDGEENLYNLRRDTKTDRMLISKEFVYLGASMCEFPAEFKYMIYSHVGQKTHNTDDVDRLWSYLLQKYPERGLIDDPFLFRKFQRYDGQS